MNDKQRETIEKIKSMDLTDAQKETLAEKLVGWPHYAEMDRAGQLHVNFFRASADPRQVEVLVSLCIRPDGCVRPHFLDMTPEERMAERVKQHGPVVRIDRQRPFWNGPKGKNWRRNPAGWIDEEVHEDGARVGVESSRRMNHS